jgi:hypothetical protein
VTLLERLELLTYEAEMDCLPRPYLTSIWEVINSLRPAMDCRNSERPASSPHDLARGLGEFDDWLMVAPGHRVENVAKRPLVVAKRA